MARIKEWEKIGVDTWKNTITGEGIYIQWFYKTSSKNLYKVNVYKKDIGTITISPVCSKTQALNIAMKYMRGKKILQKEHLDSALNDKVIVEKMIKWKYGR